MTSADDADDNQVFLRGRLAAEAVDKDMPSGDVLTVFRLTVDRPAGDRVRVDSLECVTSRPRVRRSVVAAQPGDVLEVSGSLRRRFWRGPSGATSRYAVEVASVRAVRAGRTGGASRARKPASA